jgi:hypothetical protein
MVGIGDSDTEADVTATRREDKEVSDAAFAERSAVY